MKALARLGIAPFVILLAFATHVQANIITASVPCGPGTDDDLKLWIDASSGSCSQTSTGVYECWGNNLDYVRAACNDGCEETRIDTGTTSVAGCWQGPNFPGTQLPNHTVNCGNGKIFDLTGVKGDDCKSEKDPETSKVVGGKCSQVKEGNVEDISAQTDCDTCTSSKPPGDCKMRDPK